MEVKLVINEDTVLSETIAVNSTMTTHTVTFTPDGYKHNAVLSFDFDGTVDDTWRYAPEATLTFDNISFTNDGIDQIKNGDFSINQPVFRNISGSVIPESAFGTIRLSATQLYDFISQQLIIVEEDAALGGVGDIQTIAEEYAVTRIEEKTIFALLENALRDARAKANYDELLDTTIELVATAELEALGNNVTDPNWETTLENYIALNEGVLIVSADEVIAQNEYDDSFTQERYDTEYSKQYKTDFTRIRNSFYTELYGEFAMENEGISAFIGYVQEKFSSNNLGMDQDDANKMLARLYFSVNPEEYETLYERIDNHYYERSGFFIKGIWGLITMGDVPQTSIYNHKTLSFFLPSTSSDSLDYQEIVIEGHHSTRLLLNGIIAAIAIFFLSIVWVWNIRDAYNTSMKNSNAKENNKNRISERQYFKELYDKFFEYIVLSPAVIVISFISVMPIIFGILVAFTNYNIEHIPPGQMIEWVGFSNFLEVFNFGSGSAIDFGGQFWKVFAWTLIWAVGATFTCFFGGFIQAVIISNDRVVFRKAWRSVLILPWAVPALISQMIFRVMFQDTGFVNQTLSRVGITELFHNLGFLGKTYDEAINSNAFERFFHMGTDTFQWLSNDANPWFVRIFLIVLNIWLGFPFFMALMSGVMTSIDKSLYEAASIDGATGYQKFRFITMPLVLLATSPLLVMTFSGNFNNFGVIYFITGGGPGEANFSTAYAGQTDILISWIYKLTTDANIRWYNMASVFSLLIFLIIGSVSAWNFTRTRAFKEDD
jgi:arabinogalactan oligomer/maltooligosaccharide transport system permease protein